MYLSVGSIKIQKTAVPYIIAPQARVNDKNIVFYDCHCAFALKMERKKKHTGIVTGHGYARVLLNKYRQRCLIKRLEIIFSDAAELHGV